MNEIDLNDDRFRISYFFNLDPLLLSLKEIGLLNPPVVTWRDNSYTLVCGWKRVLACQKISWSSVPVFIEEKKKDEKLFLQAFYENLATREFSLLEKAEMIKKLKDFGYKEKEIARNFLPLLSIPPTLNYLDLYLSASKMEKEVKKEVFEKNISLSTLKLLLNFKPVEQKYLISLITPVGKNKQKEIIQYLLEITKKNDTSVEKIFNLPSFKRILESAKLSSFQKSDQLRKLLRKIRYPRLTHREEKFEKFLKEIKWPPEINIQPSSCFEEDWYGVNFRFKGEKELKEKVEKLHRVINKKDLSPLFDD